MSDAQNADILDMSGVISSVWQKKWRIGITTLVLLVATYVVLSFMPRLYESSASILVEPRQNLFNLDGATQVVAAASTDDVVMASQTELIKSADTLLQVIRDMKLTEVPEFSEVKGSPLDPIFALLGRTPTQLDAEQIALQRLNKALTVIRERDSRVISAYVRSEDKMLAADIANAIATTFIARRAQQSIDDTSEATQWLDSEISKLRISVSEAEAAVAKYRVEHDLFVGPNNTTLIDQQLSDIATQITESQERKNSARSRANLIRELLAAGSSISGISDVQNSVVIQRLSEDKATLQRDRAELLATLLPNHPQIQSITSQIDEIDRQITLEGRRVAEALEAEAQIEASIEASLRDDLARLKLSASDASNFSVELQELEREASAQRDLLETYLLRYRDSLARTDASASLPDLRQITLAVPAINPASPQTMLILIAVAIFALMAQFGALVFAGFARNFGNRVAHINAPAGALFEPQIVSQPKVQTAEDVVGLLRQRRQTTNDVFAKKQEDSISVPTIEALAERVARHPRRTLVLVGMDDDEAALDCFDKVAGELVGEGTSVAIIDAGTGVPTDQMGLTDLAAGRADFGDVIHQLGDSELFETPWGTGKDLPPSAKPSVLAEALADLHDMVLVFAGTAGKTNNLDQFGDLDCVMVMVTAKRMTEQQRQSAVNEAKQHGFTTPLVYSAAETRSATDDIAARVKKALQRRQAARNVVA